MTLSLGRLLLIHLLLIGGLVLARFLMLGYGYSLPIHADLLPVLEHLRDPELYRDDLRVMLDAEPVGTRGMYSRFHTLISKPFPLPEFELVWYFVLSAATLGGLYALSWQLFKDHSAAVLGVLLITLFYVQLGSHVFIGRGPNITSDLAQAILIWGLVLFRHRPLAFSFCAGLATVFHVNIGSMFMLTYGLANLFPFALSRAWLLRQVRVGIGYLIGAIPLLWHLDDFWERTRAVGNSPYIPDILLIRDWHFDPFSNWENVPEMLLLVVIFVFVSRQFKDDDHGLVRRVFWAAFGLVVFECLLNNDWVRVGAVMNLHFTRMGQFVMMFSIIYMSYGLVKQLEQLAYPRVLLGFIPLVGIALFIADPNLHLRGRHVMGWYNENFYLLISALGFLVVGYFLKKPTQPLFRYVGASFPIMLILSAAVNFAFRPPEFMFTKEAKLPEDQIAIWIRENTEKDALIIAPPLYDRFEVLSERAIIVNRLSPTHPFLTEWAERIFDLLGFEWNGTNTHRDLENLRQYAYWELPYNAMDADRALRLREKYGADYLVIMESANLNFPMVYRCCGMVVYSLQDHEEEQ